MGTDSAHHHRPTLKQQNKPFKSKHASKGSLKDAAKGKVVRQSPKDSKKTTASLDQIRLNRRNTAKQTQAKKRASIVSATRLFSTDGAPRIVAVIPLCEDLSPAVASKAVADALGAASDDCPEEGLWRVRAERFKTSLQLMNVPYGSLYTALDAAKCADYVLFLLSPTTEVNSWGDTLLRTLQAQGLPTVVAACAPSGPTDMKFRTGILKSLLSFMQYFVPDHARVLDLAVDADRLIAARALCEGRPRDVKWRESRPYILVEDSQYSAGEGVLSLTGVVRGAALSANRLVHLPDVGDYQISKIIAAPLPRHRKSHANGDMDVEPAVLAEADTDAADSLISTNDPDDMANEQTWPTEDEMKNGDDHQNGDSIPDADKGTTPKQVRKVPKGTSAYQATWIVDDDSEAEDGAPEEEAGVAEPVEEEEMVDLPEVDMDAAETETDRRTVQFQDLEEDEEQEQLSKWRDRKREEQDDLEFPDEVDTPMDVPARERFQRYRGLRSMRTSPWDPYENLPRDYARIFQFEDFKRTEQSVKRRAEAEAENFGVEPGTRVTIHLRNVPPSVSTFLPRMLFGLLPHEHKQTVLHFAVQRNTEYSEPVRSKDPLVLCVGPRRLRVRPVYSTHSPRGSNNVHKFSRYLRHGETLVASTYGPVVYGKVPCMLLRETDDVQAPHLVATGSFVDPDPTRIIAKRIMITGHPFKVHRKTATIRYMFFNPDDVQYFAPIQLSTKHGRTGHIRESLGTHGYFKAHFDGQVSQMDTVCMSLYKRVYPRWAETWTPHSGAAGAEVTEDAMEE